MNIFNIYIYLCVTLVFHISKFIRSSEIRGPISSCRNVHESYYYKKAGLNSISEDELYRESNIFGYGAKLFPELIGELVQLPEITKSLLLTGSLENHEDFFESLVYFEKDQNEEKDKDPNSIINQDNSMLFSFNVLIRKNAIVPLYYKRYVSEVSLEEKLTYYIHPLYLIADFLKTDMSSKAILDIIEPLMTNNTDHKLNSKRTSTYYEKLNNIKLKVLKDGSYHILNNLIHRKRSGSILILKKLISHGLDINTFEKHPELFTLAVKNSNLSLVKFILEEISKFENLKNNSLNDIFEFSNSDIENNDDDDDDDNNNNYKQHISKIEKCNPKLLVNLVDNYNHTSLYYAVENNDLEMAKILINKGACINMWDPRTGYNPLMVALENHNGAMLGLIMNNGGDPLRISPVSGLDVMDLAIKENDGKMIEKIVHHKNYDINTSVNDLDSVIMEYITFQDKSDLKLIGKTFKEKLNRDLFFKQINDYEKEAKHILDIVKARISDSLLNRLLKMESKKKVAMFCQVTDEDGRGALWWSAYYGNVIQIQYILNFYSKAIRNKWVGYRSCNPHKDDKHGIYPLNLILRKSLKFPKKLIIDMLQFHDPMTNATLMLQILTKSKQPLRALKNIVYTLREKFNISYSFFNIWSDNKSVIDPIYYAMYRQLSTDVIYFLLEIATKYADELIGTTSNWKSKVIYSIQILKNAKDVDISSMLQLQEGNFFYLQHENDHLLYSRFDDNFGINTNRKNKSNFRRSDEYDKKLIKETKDFFQTDLEVKHIFDNKWRTNINSNINNHKDSKEFYSIQNDLIPLIILPPKFKSLILTKNYTIIDQSSENLARIIIGRGPSHKSIDNIRKLLEHAVGIENDSYNNITYSQNLKIQNDNIDSNLQCKTHSTIFQNQNIKLKYNFNNNNNNYTDEIHNKFNHKSNSNIQSLHSHNIISSLLLNYSPNYSTKVNQKFSYPFGEASIDLIHSIVKLRPETIGEVLTRIEYKSPSDTGRVLALLDALPQSIPPFDKNAFSPLQAASFILYRYQGQRNTLPVLHALFSPKYIKLFSTDQLLESLNILALIDYKPTNFVELFGGFSKCNLNNINKWKQSNNIKFDNIKIIIDNLNNKNNQSLQKNSKLKQDQIDDYDIYFNNIASVKSTNDCSIKLNLVQELKRVQNLPWDKNLSESDFLFCLYFLITIIIFFCIYYNSYNFSPSSNSIDKKTSDYSNKYCFLPFSEMETNLIMDFGLTFMFNIPLPSKGNIKLGIWNSIKSCFLLNKISDFFIKRSCYNEDLQETLEYSSLSFIKKSCNLINTLKSCSIILIFLWIFICQMYEEMACFLFLTSIAILIYTFHGYRIDEDMYNQLYSCFKSNNCLLLPDIIILYEQTNSQVIRIAKKAIALHSNLKKSSLNNNSDKDDYLRNMGKFVINRNNLHPSNKYTDISDIGLLEISKLNYNNTDKIFKCYRLLFIIQLICIFFSFAITLKLPLSCYIEQTNYNIGIWKNSIYDISSMFSKINTCRKLYQFQYPNLYQLTRFYPIIVSIMHYIIFIYYWQLLSMISSPILSIILALYHFYSLANVFNFALSTPINILLPNARKSKLMISNSYSSKEISRTNSVITPKLFEDNQILKERLSSQNKIQNNEQKNNFILKNKQDSSVDNIDSLNENCTKIGESSLYSHSQLSNSLLSPNNNSQIPEIGLVNLFKLNNYSYLQNQDVEYLEYKDSLLCSSIDNGNTETTYYQVLEAQIYPFFIWADSRRTSHRICKYFWKSLDIFRDILTVITILLSIFYYYVEIFSLPIKTIRLWDVICLSIFTLGLFLIYIIYLMVEIHRMTLEFWRWVPDIYDILPICSNLLNSVETTVRLLPFLTSPFYILNIPVKFPLLFASILFIILSINIII